MSASDGKNLLLRQSGVREHADLYNNPVSLRASSVCYVKNEAQTHLRQDMIPSSWRRQADEFIIQSLPHRLDPPTHVAQIIVPVLAKLPRGEDCLHNIRTSPGRQRIFTTDEVAQVGQHDPGDGIGLGGGSRHDVQRASALAVESEVLGEGLRNAELELRTDVQEMLDDPCVLVDAP